MRRTYMTGQGAYAVLPGTHLTITIGAITPLADVFCDMLAGHDFEIGSIAFALIGTIAEDACTVPEEVWLSIVSLADLGINKTPASHDIIRRRAKEIGFLPCSPEDAIYFCLQNTEKLPVIGAIIGMEPVPIQLRGDTVPTIFAADNTCLHSLRSDKNTTSVFTDEMWIFRLPK